MYLLSSMSNTEKRKMSEQYMDKTQVRTSKNNEINVTILINYSVLINQNVKN